MQFLLQSTGPLWIQLRAASLSTLATDYSTGRTASSSQHTIVCEHPKRVTTRYAGFVMQRVYAVLKLVCRRPVYTSPLSKWHTEMDASTCNAQLGSVQSLIACATLNLCIPCYCVTEICICCRAAQTMQAVCLQSKSLSALERCNANIACAHMAT